MSLQKESEWEWKEYEKKVSEAWWNYWNYQGHPDRDHIEKWWFLKIREILANREKEIAEEVESMLQIEEKGGRLNEWKHIKDSWQK